MKDTASALREVMENIKNANSGAEVISAIPEYALVLQQHIALGLEVDRAVKDAHKKISTTLASGVWVGKEIGESLGHIVGLHIDAMIHSESVWDVLDDVKLFIFSAPLFGDGVEKFYKIIESPVSELYDRLSDSDVEHTGEFMTFMMQENYNPGVLLNNPNIDMFAALEALFGVFDFKKFGMLSKALRRWDRFDEHMATCFKILVSADSHVSMFDLHDFTGGRFTEMALSCDEMVNRFTQLSHVDTAISKMDKIDAIDMEMLSQCLDKHSKSVNFQLYLLSKKTMESQKVNDYSPEKVARVIFNLLIEDVDMALDLLRTLSNSPKEMTKSVLKYMGLERPGSGSVLLKLIGDYGDSAFREKITTAILELRKDGEVDEISLESLILTIRDSKTPMVERLRVIEKLASCLDERNLDEIEKIIMQDPVLCVACHRHGVDMATTGIVNDKAYNFISNINYLWAAIGQNDTILPFHLRVNANSLANAIRDFGSGEFPEHMYIENLSITIMGVDDARLIFNAIADKNRADLLIDWLPTITPAHCGVLADALSNEKAAWPLVDLLLTQCKINTLGELKLNDGYRNSIAERVSKLSIGDASATLGVAGFVPEMPSEIEEAWALVRTSQDDIEGLGLVIKQGLAQMGPDVQVAHHSPVETFTFECGV